MNIKRTISIALATLALPFINATGGDFTIYTPSIGHRLETHLQFSHGFYSALQFLPNQLIRHSYGLYAVVNNTVFMVTLDKNYEFLPGKKNVAETIEISAEDYLSQINVAQLDKEDKVVYLNKRFEYERFDNVEVTGKLGFW